MYNTFLKLSESNLKGNTMQKKGKEKKKQQLIESASQPRKNRNITVKWTPKNL